MVIALAVATVIGITFGIYPRLDLQISAPFYNPRNNLFVVNAQPWVMASRDAARWLIAFIFAPACFAIVGKIIMPGRRMLISGRATLFLVLTMALGPGVLTNIVLKERWGRTRPIDVIEFGGTGHFTAWWDLDGDCPNNCSFVAGEPSGAFWTLAAASLAPPQWRMLAYGGALAIGAAVGALRIGAGAHFFTDVMFAGVFTFLLTWVIHGLIYRWRATCMSDDAVERSLARIGAAIRRALAGFAGGHC